MSLFNTRIPGFVLTRDSWIWFWSKAISIAGLVVSGAIQPASLGLTDKQAHIAMGISAALLAIAAQFSTSALPGKADADKVTLPVKES